jgi:hypothetical protein
VAEVPEFGDDVAGGVLHGFYCTRRWVLAPDQWGL